MYEQMFLLSARKSFTDKEIYCALSYMVTLLMFEVN